MTDLIYSIGDLFQSAFKIIDKLENLPNLLFILVIAGSMAVWFYQQSNYNKEAENKGTLK